MFLLEGRTVYKHLRSIKKKEKRAESEFQRRTAVGTQTEEMHEDREKRTRRYEKPDA